MPTTYLKYRGAVYRKAADAAKGGDVLDEKILMAAWNALRPKVKELESQFKEKILDKVIEDANKVLSAETAKFSKDAGKALFDALLAELAAGTGGVDIASNLKVISMRYALWYAVKDGFIDQNLLMQLFGWIPPSIEKIKYRDMEKYFDVDKPEGKSYLHEILVRLEPVLEKAVAAHGAQPPTAKPVRQSPPKPPKLAPGRHPAKLSPPSP